ncbi:transport between ER and Golgi ATPase protein [Pichia californica]|uniref:Vesicular-fusion protein SEC18 n=1 Tax=Pichia californica TaxID=460514 RepID=A0A9P6WMN4_9ASCO|nr:transport between ER and Golgi ATPase protein [[Candida] californica]KAG0689892.1 transport between ER and Golgi ATPase protein [[Candida] californica]
MQQLQNILTIKPCPEMEDAKKNIVTVSIKDFKDNTYLIIDKRFVFTCKSTEKVESGKIGLSYDQRAWGLWYTGRRITVSEYNLVSEMKLNPEKVGYLGVLNVNINFLNRGKSKYDSTIYDPDKMAKAFIKKFRLQILQPTQILLFEYKNTLFELVIRSIVILSLGRVSIDDVYESSNILSKGIVVDTTIVNLFNNANNLVALKRFKTCKKNPYGIIRPDIKFKSKKRGIDKETTDIFRLIFASRIFPKYLTEKMNMHHIKGLIICSNTCFSKTVFSEKIGNKLNAKGPKIYDCLKLFRKNKNFGSHVTDEIFKYSETEYKNKGKKSALHIIVFDKMDIVFEQYNSWVAQRFISEILSRMDGTKKIENILIIAMVKNVQFINSELLKPGRFEVQVSTDFKGRYQKDMMKSIEIDIDKSSKDLNIFKPSSSYQSPNKR